MVQTLTLYSVARRVAGVHGKILLTETLIAHTDDRKCLTLESVHMERIERFVVFMYNKTCACSYGNDASNNLLFTGSLSLENILATQAALLEHFKISVLQASLISKEILHAPDFGMG